MRAARAGCSPTRCRAAVRRRALRRRRPPPAPRAAGHEDDYALLVEEIHEGYLLHYAAGRVVRPEDPDLSLLAGDRLYALGLARLAELGDLEAVGELADVISLAAQAHAEGDPERAAAVWEAGARAVGDGPAADHEAAKAAWRGAGRLRRPAARRLGSIVVRDSQCPRPAARPPKSKYTADRADPGRLRGRDRHAPALHGR